MKKLGRKKIVIENPDLTNPMHYFFVVSLYFFEITHVQSRVQTRVLHIPRRLNDNKEQQLPPRQGQQYEKKISPKLY